VVSLQFVLKFVWVGAALNVQPMGAVVPVMTWPLLNKVCAAVPDPLNVEDTVVTKLVSHTDSDLVILWLKKTQYWNMFASVVALAVFQFNGAVPATCLVTLVTVPTVMLAPYAVVNTMFALSVMLCTALGYTMVVVCTSTTSPTTKEVRNVAPGQLRTLVVLV